jgi:hypothetical protein
MVQLTSTTTTTTAKLLLSTIKTKHFLKKCLKKKKIPLPY